MSSSIVFSYLPTRLRTWDPGTSTKMLVSTLEPLSPVSWYGSSIPLLGVLVVHERYALEHGKDSEDVANAQVMFEA